MNEYCKLECIDGTDEYEYNKYEYNKGSSKCCTSKTKQKGEHFSKKSIVWA